MSKPYQREGSQWGSEITVDLEFHPAADSARLEATNIRGGQVEDPDSESVRYYAVASQPGYNVSETTREPKLAVLYTTRDGRRAIETRYRAVVDDGQLVLREPERFAAVVARAREFGDSVPENHATAHALVVEDLYTAGGQPAIDAIETAEVGVDGEQTDPVPDISGPTGGGAEVHHGP